ncbi:MAG TPA: tetratricopeptide repeat protein [Alphaproteobacteria bacterium]|nr:tetratricopeptide repeat protein [Alphaproteobacteria bacterium]
MRRRAVSIFVCLTACGMMFAAASAHANMSFSPAVGLAIDSQRALNENQPKKAIELGQKAIKSMDLPPSFSAYVWNNMCVAYTQLTKFSLALDSCEQALKFNSADWRFLNNRGNALLGMGLADDAITAYQAALKDNPNSRILQKNLEIAKKYKETGGVPLTFSQQPRF